MKKVSFYCQACGHETPKWLGKCPGCKEWNTIVEEIKKTSSGNACFGLSSGKINPVLIQDV